MADGVSIIIPVLNRLEFTRLCLNRIVRHTSAQLPYEVIVVDNGSSDGTAEYFRTQAPSNLDLIYHRSEANLGFARANNTGARLARRSYLLFLNNDTLVQPGWLEEMVATAEADGAVGVVGIKQLFPYTNTIHHTGIIFTASKGPQHIYPFADASLPYANRQREYQAVNGACLLISKELFDACGGFDECYVNGFEDLDLCMAVRKRGRKVVCCTKAFIYHYGQISEGRTVDDPHNERYFWSKWRSEVRLDEGDYFRADQRDRLRAESRSRVASLSNRLPDDVFHFAPDLSIANAFTWVMAELALALVRAGVPVQIRRGDLTPTLDREVRRELQRLMVEGEPVGGTQLKWSHFWEQYLGTVLMGRINLEFFVINYRFDKPNTQPWDSWLQCLRQNHYHKLPVSSFCGDVLHQIGVPEQDCHVVPHGYSREIGDAPKGRSRGPCRLLTVTNSHDLERYGTLQLLDAYWRTFTARDDVILVVKDYGMGAADSRLRDRLQEKAPGKARIEYLTRFTTKQRLIELYQSCDAFVSPHRAEGFGMKILDAAACGLPIVAPLFGGPVDFLTPDNCLPLAFELAPLGDCLDARQLRITNGPVWCEPDVTSLSQRLREVYDDPDRAHAIGERARKLVVSEYTWDRAAQKLVDAAHQLRDRMEPRDTHRPTAANGLASQLSPYWLGTRVSVIVPTRNRKQKLLNCLKALDRQSVLATEFEVIVVDDGSGDGTAQALEGLRFGFDLRYERQESQGAGQARNRGLALARGGLVLFIGDDIVPHERLLEEHLLAHARHPDTGSAILGYTDWLPGLTRTPVMDYVCGQSSLQFAYEFIPGLPRLDYRFFYTSNISLKRRFMQEALDAGIRFDPCFRTAAFEDTELALRLERLGLQIHYAAKAIAYHDHAMDLASFSDREFNVGRSAVILYRKHPALDPLIEVRWIGTLIDNVEELMARPVLLEKVRALDTHGDVFLTGIAEALEKMLALPEVAVSGLASTTPPERLRTALEAVYAAIFDLARTRGKVDEWFSNVRSPEKRAVAQHLIGCMRKLDFLARHSDRMGILRDASVPSGQIEDLRARLLAVEGEAKKPWARSGTERSTGRFHRIVPSRVRQRLAMPLRAADLAVQARLHRRSTWLTRYLRVRNGVRRAIKGGPTPGQ